MKFNKNKCSKRMQKRFSSLGVYIQPDGSIAVSEYLPNNHDKNMYMVKFQSFKECLKYLNANLDEIQDNFVSLWKSFEEDCVSSIELEEVDSSIKEEIVESSINSLLAVAKNYESLHESYHRLTVLKSNIKYIKNSFRKKITYYATLIDHSEIDMVEEFMRAEDIEIILKLHKEAGAKKMITAKPYKKPYGESEGFGPGGRSSPWEGTQETITPMDGFDDAEGRVMDGTGIEQGKGHATEKFEIANKFKRHPELRFDSNMQYKTKPLKYISKKMRRRLDRKRQSEGKGKTTKDDYFVEGNGEVTMTKETEIWGETNRFPHSWENRDTESPYPSWSAYN